MREQINQENANKIVAVNYACLFCKTGKEAMISQIIMQNIPSIEATDIRQIKHRSIDGQKLKEIRNLLPGYVFLRIPQGKKINPYDCTKIEGVFRLLTQSNGDWQLDGADEAFVSWVFEREGLIGLSEAIAQGSKVKVLSGPLKDLEGHIVKIDKRGRNGQIEIKFDSRVWRFWLAFEYTEVKLIKQLH